MAESNIIVIVYFFLLSPGEYMTSKSEITPFHIKDNVFSCNCTFFAVTATPGNLQAANFITMTFTTQNNA